MLLARIYEVLPLLCPACGGPMRSPLLPHRSACRHRNPRAPRAAPQPPPISPARGPPGTVRSMVATSWIRLRPSIPPRPSPSQTSCSTSRCRASSTTEGPPPAVCPDKLSHSATSFRPSEHPHVPLHHPSVTRASLGNGSPPDSPDPYSPSHATLPPTALPLPIGRFKRLSLPFAAHLYRLRRPDGGRQMKILAFLTDPPVVSSILLQ